MPRAHRLREEIFDARRSVLSTSSHFKKSVRITTTNTLASTFISSWLADAKLENYSLMVASIAGCVEAVKRGRAEFALVPHFGEDEAFTGLRARQVGEDRLALVASPALKHPVALIARG